MLADTSENKNDSGKPYEVINFKNIKLIGGLHTLHLRDKNKETVPFFKYFSFYARRYKLFTYKYSEGVKVYSLKSSLFKYFNFIYPKNKNEQIKIVDCLFKLDGKFDILKQKIKILKQYKKGLTHKLLKKTIIAWINRDFSNTIKLKDILFEHKEYSIKKGNYVHVTLSKEGILLKNQRYNRDFLVKNNFKKYKITKKWDICYNPANLKFGVITLNKYGDGIFSPIYITFSISELINKEYLISLLQDQNFINYSIKFEEGTVYERRAVSVIDFLNIHLVLDNKELQFKYGEILEKIDQLILIHNSLIQLLIKSKSYLMKNMFI